MSGPEPDVPWWAFDGDTEADLDAVRAPLAPAQQTEAPLSAEDRERRARLLAGVREANHRARCGR